MRPSALDVHIDTTLKNVSVRTETPPFVSRRILPVVKVNKQSDRVRTYDNDHLRDDVPGPLGDRAPAPEVDFGINTTGYSVKRYGYVQLLPDTVVANADAPLDLFVDTRTSLVTKLGVFEERTLASFMNTTANFTGQNVTLSGSDQWQQFGESVTRSQNGGGSGLSNPLTDIMTARESVRTNAGRDANLFVIGAAPWAQLRIHPDVISSLYGAKDDGAQATEAAFANFIGVDEVIVGNAIFNNAVENASDSLADIWGNHAWLIYRTPRPGLRSVSWGNTFVFETPETKDFQIKRWRNNNPEGWWLKVESEWDQRVLSASSAYMIRNAIA